MKWHPLSVWRVYLLLNSALSGYGLGCSKLTVYTSKWGHGPVFVSRSFQVGANGYLLVGDARDVWDSMGFPVGFPTIGHCSVHCDSKDGRTTWGSRNPHM